MSGPVQHPNPVRARLDHPVIDGDGHLIEFMPVIREFVAEDAGESVAAKLDAVIYGSRAERQLSRDERRVAGAARRVWWGLPTANTLDRATAMLPRLMYERLDELGIDFAMLYPTYGLLPMFLPDDELRPALARACNRYYAEHYGPYRDRMEPVAIIPTHTPEEAIAELDHAVGELGLKAIIMTGVVTRPFPGVDVPGAHWVDTIAHDSIHDYDPLWRRCVELGVAPTFHGAGYGWGSRTSTTNYVFNHIGNFAVAQEAACRATVMGGVATRFPELRFAFLEGGVAWASNLCADLVGHWEKRNGSAVRSYDPAALDRPLMERLIREKGSSAVAAHVGDLDYALQLMSDPDELPESIDEFAGTGLSGADDIEELFTKRFFFGCEADDPMTAIAFDDSLPPVGAALRPIFASDIGHWDVPDARGVLDEAWELVDDGQLDLAAFRAFTFSNAVSLWAGANPAFFDDTVVADEVRAELQREGVL